MESELQNLLAEKQSLSILKVREKRSLAFMIDELENKRLEKEKSLNEEIEKIEKKIERLKTTSKFAKEIRTLTYRISNIDKKLELGKLK